MKALVLVDLDNVLDADGPSGLVATARPTLERVAKRGVDECVVAFAFNTRTADKDELTFDSLSAAGRQFAAALAAPRWSVELGLTLTMPQTADVLLARLARQAPSEAGAGPYEAALLLSKDRDLCNGLRDEFYVRGGRTGWIELPRKWLATAWVAAGGGGTLMRKPSPKARASGAQALALDGVYTELVASRAAAGWAAERSVDLDPSLELYEIARLIDDEPWLLSQVGATRSSLRGIARLRSNEAEWHGLGVVCEKDGLELRGAAARPSCVADVSTATVGIGAAHFGGGRATLPSRLPNDVLKAIGADIRADRRGVVVRDAIVRLRRNEALGTQPVIVELKVRRKHLVAKVAHGGTAQPRAWWITGHRKTKSEREVQRAGRFLPAGVRGAALPCRATHSDDVRLGLRAPLQPGESVRCDAPIAQGTIGQAWWDPPHGKPKPIALYSPAARIAPTEALTVTPIQLAPRTGVFSCMPAGLRVLPLVVPT